MDWIFSKRPGWRLWLKKQFGLDPRSSFVVVIRSKRGDRIEVIGWGGSGRLLTYKQPESGLFLDVHRSQGPANVEEVILGIAKLDAVENEARGSPPDPHASLKVPRLLVGPVGNQTIS